MSALSNVDTRRGGDKPSSAGPTSCISPEVQSHLIENSNTGVSMNCVPKGKKVWIVFRTTSGGTEKVLGIQQSKSIETYMPMHYVVEEINGKRKLVHEPLLTIIILALKTREI